MIILYETGSIYHANKLFATPSYMRWRSDDCEQSAILIDEIPENVSPMLTEIEVPRDIDRFFKTLKNALAKECQYRIVDGGRVLEVAVHPRQMGEWIGRGGETARAVSRHLRIHLSVVEGISVCCTDSKNPHHKDTRPKIDPKFVFDPVLDENGEIIEGWIAPWKVIPVRSRVQFQIKRKEI